MRFLVADDHEIVRKGLIGALRELDHQAEIKGVNNAEETRDAVASGKSYDLILLDLFMPGANGFDLLRDVCNECMDTPVVVLSGSGDPLHMRKSLDLGAAGFVPKSAGLEVMLSALRLVLAGGIYVPPDILNRPNMPSAIAEENTAKGHSLGELTARQKEILSLLGEGKSNKEIARQLNLSEHTIKVHVAAVLRILGVNNRTKAAMVAREFGLVTEG